MDALRRHRGLFALLLGSGESEPVRQREGWAVFPLQTDGKPDGGTAIFRPLRNEDGGGMTEGASQRRYAAGPIREERNRTGDAAGMKRLTARFSQGEEAGRTDGTAGMKQSAAHPPQRDGTALSGAAPGTEKDGGETPPAAGQAERESLPDALRRESQERMRLLGLEAAGEEHAFLPAEARQGRTGGGGFATPDVPAASQAREGGAAESGLAAGETPGEIRTARALSWTIERDARRYDGGYPLY